jgi:hypothetical protein
MTTQILTIAVPFLMAVHVFVAVCIFNGAPGTRTRTSLICAFVWGLACVFATIPLCSLAAFSSLVQGLWFAGLAATVAMASIIMYTNTLSETKKLA